MLGATLLTIRTPDVAARQAPADCTFVPSYPNVPMRFGGTAWLRASESCDDYNEWSLGMQVRPKS